MGRRKQLGAGYRQRSDGRIEYRWTDESGKRRSVCAKTLEECQDKVRKKQADLDAGILSGRCTFSALCTQFNKMKEKEAKPATMRTYEKLQKSPLDIIGRMDVQKISPIVIDSLGEDIRKLHKEKQSARIMAHVCYVFDYAVSIRMIQHNPGDHLKGHRPKQSGDKKDITQTAHRALTDAELKGFFAAAAESSYLHLFRFLAATGCRAGEAAALTAADIDYKAGTISISKTVSVNTSGKAYVDPTTKSKRARVIGLTDDVRRILADQAALLDGLFPKVRPMYIFPAPSGGIATAVTLDKIIYKICDAAKIPRFSLHAFRHTYATRAIQCGMQPHELQQHLGHASITLTMDLYYHHTTEAATAAAAKVRVPV